MVHALESTIMDKLPVEILCDIFLKSLPEQSSERGGFMRSVLAPLRISHVCQRWRTFSLSTGELWSYLYLNLIEEVERQRRVVEIFDTWIERTNGSPLNFSIHCGIMDAAETYKNLHITAEYIISTLLAEQWRWKDVDFGWDESEDSVEMTNMPMLTSLTLNLVEPSNNLVLKETNIIVNIARSARLRRLFLWGNYILNVGEEPIYTLTGPVYLACMRHVPQMAAERSCLDLLRVAPNLKLLYVDFRAVRQRPMSQTNMQHIQIVHDLEVLEIHLDSSASVINSLTLPGLKVLTYCQEFVDIQPEVATNFLRRSMPPLTHLDIYGVLGEQNSLVATLQLLPTLRYLRIRGVPVSTQLFRSLDVTNSSADENRQGKSILCPDLRHLCLYKTDIPQDIGRCVEELCSMLVTRSSILDTFKRVRCMSPHEFAISDISSNIGVLHEDLGSGLGLTISDVDTWRSPFDLWF